MFKITKTPEFCHQVKVKVPVDGGFETSTFTARFRALTISETEKFDTMTVKGTTDYLRAIFVGWGDDLVGDDLEPVAYSDKQRDQLIDMAPVRQALLETYNAALLGVRQGN